MRIRVPLLPLALLLLAMISIQMGAAIAKTLFATLGAAGATALRLVLATAILMAVLRPWRGLAGSGDPRALLGYGVALGLMNLFFYMALARVPLGLVVAIEFLGPLAVAIGTSRRALDLAWAAVAVVGLLLLLPLGTLAPHLDLLGVCYALLAAAGWAAYIVYGARAGRGYGPRVVAWGMAVATLVVLPVGAVQAGATLLLPDVLPLALLVAVLSSALPYTLEMHAMTHLPTRTFGILMCLEPALAALAGWLLLHEQLTALQWTAVGCVMLASAGSVASGARAAVS